MNQFQAVVMALGHGSRMTDLTSHCPKPLLPVGNYPMIWYPLHSLEIAGFEEVIIITSEASKNRIYKELTGKLKLKLDVVDIPDEEWGTAESLNFISDKIKSDLLVISCDVIMDVDLHEFVKLHRVYDSALTALFVPFTGDVRLVAPGSKSKPNLEHDFVGLDPKSGQLLFVCAEADLHETLGIRRTIAEKHPNFKIHSNLLDAHLYLMKKTILDRELKEKSFSSLKGELIPHIIKKQFEDSETKVEPVVESKDNLSLDSLTVKKSVEICQLTSSTDFSFDDTKIRCYGHIAEKGFCIRANTLSSYFTANKKVMHLNFNDSRIDLTVDKKNFRVDTCSYVGANSVIGPKSSIKSSIIGSNCRIGDKVQLINCLIMNNIVIGEGCNLEGCIVADDAKIGSGCKLKDCLVTANVTVDDSVKLSKELISDTQQMMEIE